MPKSEPPRDVAILRGFDADDALVFEQTLAFFDYYEELHDVIDSEPFRAERGIMKLVGDLFDDNGVHVQHFENQYTESGEMVGGFIRHDDGTITKH